MSRSKNEVEQLAMDAQFLALQNRAETAFKELKVQTGTHACGILRVTTKWTGKCWRSSWMLNGERITKAGAVEAVFKHQCFESNGRLVDE